MKTKHLLIGAILPAAMICSAALTIPVNELTTRPAIPVYTPVVNDSVNNKGKKFDEKKLLAEHVDIDFNRGESAILRVGADTLFTFTRPRTGEVMYVAQTAIRPAEYSAGILKVASTAPFSVLIDGKEQIVKETRQDTLTAAATKDAKLTMESQQLCRITIKLLAAASDKADPQLKLIYEPDKASENVPTAISSTLKGRFMLADTDQGERAVATSLSPDGKYVITTLRNRLENQSVQQRYEISETQTGRIIMQTNDMVGWMPKGNRLYSCRKNNDGYDIYITNIPSLQTSLLCAGAPEKPYAWSPDETFFLYTYTDSPDKEVGPLRRYTSPDDRIVGNRQRTFLKMYSPSIGASRTLTYGTKSTRYQDISADGTKILFMTERETPTKYPFYAFTLVQLRIDNMQADTIINDNPYITSAVYSPDDKQLFIMGSPRAFGQTGLNAGNHPIPNDFDAQGYIYDISTGNVSAPTRDFNPSLVHALWNKADGRIYFNAQDGFHTRLYSLDPRNNNKITELPANMQNIGNFNMGRNESQWITFTGQGDTYAARACVLNLRNNRTRIIIDPFASRLDELELGLTEHWNFTAKDGTLIEGTVTLPPDFDAQKKYPLLVYYYGGTSPSQHGLLHPYVPQLYASRGYVVYVLNPSGTYGYGQEFSARHVNAWGKQTADDIIEGVKKFCDAHTYVNAKKIGCFGASYGGFMTQYLLTRTDIFAAAMSHAGISDVTSYWGEGYWGYSYNSVAAAESYPWTNPELFTQQGSLYNADKIHTPLLLMHGTADTNVPIGESIQIFNALSILGRDVEFISVDGGDHTSGSFSYDKRLLWHRTVMAWFARWLKDDPRWWNEIYPQPHL